MQEVVYGNSYFLFTSAVNLKLLWKSSLFFKNPVRDDGGLDKGDGCAGRKRWLDSKYIL